MVVRMQVEVEGAEPSETLLSHRKHNSTAHVSINSGQPQSRLRRPHNELNSSLRAARCNLLDISCLHCLLISTMAIK